MKKTRMTRHLRNRQKGVGGHAGFSGPAAQCARRDIRTWPGYAPTPLLRLEGFARQLGIEQVYAKHEGLRSPLASFKMLGAPHALIELVRGRIGPVSAASLMTGEHRTALVDLTVVCASDGNHGRALAWAASKLGCRARIYLPAGVSGGRADAIERWGAEVVRVDDNYDAAVARAARDAAANGWHVISDTAYPGYNTVPRQIMEGYTLVAEEIVSQVGEGLLPTHVILQVGCGGMAASIMSALETGWPGHRPRFVTVEPVTAACLLETAAADHPVRVEGDHETIMGGLACGEVSEVAWEYLRASVDDYLAMPDSYALEAMRALAGGTTGDGPIVSGETGAAGLGALLLMREESDIREAVGLDRDSVALVIITEGATDADEYQRLVGQRPEDINNAETVAA